MHRIETRYAAHRRPRPATWSALVRSSNCDSSSNLNSNSKIYAATTTATVRRRRRRRWKQTANCTRTVKDNRMQNVLVKSTTHLHGFSLTHSHTLKHPHTLSNTHTHIHTLIHTTTLTQTRPNRVFLHAELSAFRRALNAFNLRWEIRQMLFA